MAVRASWGARRRACTRTCDEVACETAGVSEPREVAQQAREIIANVWHWEVHDDRIDHPSDAYAVIAHEGPQPGAVLVDPIWLAPAELERLGIIVAICLTGAHHQRAAWRYRRRLGVPVWAPEGHREMDEEPDETYAHDDLLPGGLVAIHSPGPTEANHALWHVNAGALMLGDLLIRSGPEAPLEFVRDAYQDEPAATVTSVERLVALMPSAVCPGHGPPIVGEGVQAMRAALDGGRRP